MKLDRDPSIENEPHLQQRRHEPQPGDAPLGLVAQPTPFSHQSNDDVDHSVWDEPALAAKRNQAPKDALTYANWLHARRARWSAGQAWWLTLGVAALAGPWGLITSTLLGVNFGQGDGLVIFVFGPLIQEMCKMALPLWIVEKRPYFFTEWFQIFVCSMASATAFAAAFVAVNHYAGIVPVEQHTPRVLVFLSVHVICSTLAALGLEKIWRRAILRHERPQLTDGANWLMAAYLLHVAYVVCLHAWDLVHAVLAA